KTPENRHQVGGFSFPQRAGQLEKQYTPFRYLASWNGVTLRTCRGLLSIAAWPAACPAALQRLVAWQASPKRLTSVEQFKDDLS
ncbi:hypothetical protein, partial [Arthrobacter glacialis]|uniref:hypothetical protein n=1 Tax=Arthrobacter glacialis TaxID=1664 RepID=UPI001A9C6ED5